MNDMTVACFDWPQLSSRLIDIWRTSVSSLCLLSLSSSKIFMKKISYKYDIFFYNYESLSGLGGSCYTLDSYIKRITGSHILTHMDHLEQTCMSRLSRAYYVYCCLKRSVYLRESTHCFWGEWFIIRTFTFLYQIIFIDWMETYFHPSSIR